ncbi:MAG: lytic transglycosylase domain-containing protein [Proteobacteria bacterium]|nr:lytic transglycosylase domain-containing protein [Pseudomonadota bacterium]NDD03880.1 lytic transglycosylase domain-containing protein [Pseudomonadota bacterium]NDG26454.1 lytic transglycosylase domain-containing protein [Pseudomonadota bacterium]
MKALQEDHCPNNIATALAAFLEDELPNNISLEKLAELYQKGGTCPTEDPNDAETLSTRAGLMFFAAKQWDKAEVCFQNSNQLKKAFRSRALYWLSRVHEEKGNRSAAKKDIQELKHSYPFAFHTLMALTSRDEDPGEVLERNEPSLLTRSQQAPQLNNLTEQVELLTQFGLLQAADKVLTWIISDSQNAEPEFMLYLSDLRESHGNQLGRLTILSNMLYANPAFTSKSVMERYFPKIYFPIFEKYSQGLDPYLLMALARRESAFNPKAVSRAKAKGLMQIAPHTQRKLTSLKNIFNPEDNISLGSRYFSELIQRTNGQIHLALASYNAGPNRVEIWSSRYPMSDPILFMDLIPYRETREYVASVLRNYYWYRRLHTDRSPSSVEQLIKTTP